jgi:tetratricopeptide (TPR) repeat protein
MHNQRRTAVFFLLLCLLPTLALAQGLSGAWAGKGRLQGEVTESDTGKPVKGAKVTLKSPSDPTVGPPPIITDAKGKWSYLGLVGGTWTIAIEADGFVAAEGPAKVNEFGPSPPVRVPLKKITKEMLDAAAPKNEVREALEKGNALVAEKKWAEARAEYEKALSDPKLKEESKPMVLRAVAGTYRAEENYGKAIETTQAALAMNREVDSLMLLAQTYYDAKKTDEAIVTLKEAAVASTDDPKVVKLLVDILVDAGKEEEAKTYMAKLPEGTKIDPASLLNIGIRQFNDGKTAEALQSFNRVVDENPALADAYYYRALAFMSAGQNKEAKADLQKLLEIDPNSKFAADAKDFLKSL